MCFLKQKTEISVEKINGAHNNFQLVALSSIMECLKLLKFVSGLWLT
jgi:hypothetical protein